MTSQQAIKPILHTLAAKGSGTGVGYYTAFASGCPLSAALYNSDDRTFMSEKSGAAIGTIAHAFQELHWKRQLQPDAQPSVAVEFSQHVAEENLVEAERIFRYFRSVIPETDGLGDVVAVEQQLPGNSSQRTLLHDLFGVPFTLRVDLVTDLTQRHIDRLKKKALSIDGHVGTWKPGRYIWDYKHLGRRDSNLLDKTLGSIQYAAYIRAYNYLVARDAALSGPLVNGLIQCVLFTTKQPDMKLTIVPPPSEELVQAATRLINRGAQLAENMPDETVPSDNNCFSYGRICRWLTEGLCNRAHATDTGLVQLRKGGFIR